jgi:hypothetical protein
MRAILYALATLVAAILLTGCAALGAPLSAPARPTTPTPVSLPLPAPLFPPLGFRFHTTGYTLRPWPQQLDPYRVLPPENENFTRDAQGVPVLVVYGRTYDHPVVQAQDGLNALDRYRAGGGTAALATALADAQRLVATHINWAGAWWLPYRMDFVMYHNPALTQRAPWFSAMAQGEALNLFTQLWLVTVDEDWRTAADATFASFLHPAPAGAAQVPWVVNVDAAGYLWPQEFAGPHADDTINGANFATFGLVRYALATGDPRARLLADGAMTTMLHYIPAVERPGQVSGYSVWHLVQLITYHVIVTHQLELLFIITGDKRFAAWAARFAEDYPGPHARGGAWP